MNHYKFMIGNNFFSGTVAAATFEGAVLKIKRVMKKINERGCGSEMFISKLELISQITV